MVALTLSALLAFYLIVPALLFNFAFDKIVPLRVVTKSRAEELTGALVTAFVPFVLALCLVWHVPFTKEHPFRIASESPALRVHDYKLVIGSIYSEELFRKAEQGFWGSVQRFSYRQGRFLVWYWLFAFLEGLAIGKLANHHGAILTWFERNIAAGRGIFRAGASQIGKWVFLKILLPKVSEWHVLLTPFSDPKSAVRAQILVTDGTIYSGEVYQHYLDKEGRLSGLILINARRRKPTAAEDADKNPKPWRSIPGAKLYFFSDRIVNLNLHYQSDQPAPESIRKVLLRVSQQREVPNVTVSTITFRHAPASGPAGRSRSERKEFPTEQPPE